MILENLKVLFYVPNLLDYTRLYLLYEAFFAIEYMNDRLMFTILYLMSYLLDAIDGPVARYLKQTSHLGIYLDMIADRLSSCMLLHYTAQAVLLRYEPSLLTKFFHYFLYFCLFVVEIVSHLVVMLESEREKKHQKDLSVDTNTIVRLYLKKKSILFLSCASFELFNLAVLLKLKIYVQLFFFPLFIFRVVANLLRFYFAIMARINPKVKDKAE